MPNSILDLMPEEAMVVGVHADSWQDAIRLAGANLIAGGIATDRYTDEMIESVNELGPYIVVTKGFALAHARPSDAVLKTGFSWVTLDEGVNFGSKNDPVRIVVGLAGFDHEEHLHAMQQLAKLIAGKGRVSDLAELSSISEVRQLLGQFEGN